MVCAAAVSVCALVSLMVTARALIAAVRGGEAIPTGMVMLTLVTLLCTAVIWKGVGYME